MVANLMALGEVDVDDTVTTPELTRAVLSHYHGIPVRMMFHGKVPMESYGGWSWCPPSIFDLDNLGHAMAAQHISKTFIYSRLGDFTYFQ